MHFVSAALNAHNKRAHSQPSLKDISEKAQMDHPFYCKFFGIYQGIRLIKISKEMNFKLASSKSICAENSSSMALLFSPMYMGL
jgi:hypothetical protein